MVWLLALDTRHIVGSIPQTLWWLSASLPCSWLSLHGQAGFGGFAVFVFSAIMGALALPAIHSIKCGWLVSFWFRFTTPLKGFAQKRHSNGVLKIEVPPGGWFPLGLLQDSYNRLLVKLGQGHGRQEARYKMAKCSMSCCVTQVGILSSPGWRETSTQPRAQTKHPPKDIIL